MTANEFVMRLDRCLPGDNTAGRLDMLIALLREATVSGGGQIDLETKQYNQVAAKPSGFVPMPKGIDIRQLCNEPCDMAIGPCCCGATHDMAFWETRGQNQVTAKQFNAIVNAVNAVNKVPSDGATQNG